MIYTKEDYAYEKVILIHEKAFLASGYERNIIRDGRHARESIGKAINLYQKINDKESIKTLANDFAEKKSLFIAANLHKKIGDFESASKMLELASKDILKKESDLLKNLNDFENE